MQDIGQVLQAQGVPQEVVQTLRHRWAESTHKNYDAIWRRWRIFCRDRRCSLFNPPTSSALAFLAQEWEVFGTASAVNHALSGISGAIQLVSQRTISENPLIKSYRQAVNALRPPAPASDDTWDISILFKYIRKMGDNRELSVQRLRQKAIVLLRTDIMGRSSDLEKLFRGQIAWDEKYFRVRFYKPKEWRADGKFTHGVWSAWVTVHKYDKDPTLCTYRVLREYLSRVQDDVVQRIKVDGVVEPQLPLFASLYLHNLDQKCSGLKSGTFSSIVSEFMKEVGIPTKFKAKSLRGSVASCAIDFGVPEQAVLRQARWSDKKLFYKFYYRKIGRAPPVHSVSRSASIAEVLRASVPIEK